MLYHQLIESTVDWLAYLDESRPALPDKKTPRPHQQKAIDDVIEGFTTNDRGRLIMACGTGKTLVGAWVAEKLKSARTLVLVPSLSILSQKVPLLPLRSSLGPRGPTDLAAEILDA